MSVFEEYGAFKALLTTAAGDIFIAPVNMLSFTKK